MNDFGPMDRGVSIAVTHVLALGITGILIGVLVFGSGALVDLQTERSASGSLEIIGERLASELTYAEQIAVQTGSTVTIQTDHPRTVAGIRYEVEMSNSNCGSDLLDSSRSCLILRSSNGDITEYVPVTADLASSTTQGGSIVIEHDGTEATFE